MIAAKGVALEKIAQTVDYGVTASAAWEKIGPKFLRITDIQDGGVDWESVPWCACTARESTEAQLKGGDIVFARTGATTGKSYLIRECPDNAVFASYLIRVRLAAGADPSYISQYFKTPEYWSQITSGTRGVAQPGVNATTLKALRIPLPPVPEQRRIAAILDQAETLRSHRRAALAQLDSLAESVFLDMFGDPATNPRSWPVKTIEELCEVKGGKRLPKGAEYSATPTPFRYVRVTNLSNGRVDESKLLYLKPEVQKEIARYVVKTGDVIISIAGSIGLVAAVPNSLEGANLTENAAMLVARRSGDYLPDFLAFMLRMKAIQDQIDSHVGQVTIGKLALFRIEKLCIPLPPLSLQKTFATSIQAIEALKATHRAALAELDALFASLQHRAFAGQF